MEQHKGLKHILSDVKPDSCPSTLNFHCHTTCSDGSLSPVELIKQATDKQIEHLSVTDHNTVSAYKLMNKWLDDNKYKYHSLPKLWTGIELTGTLKKTLVHIIGLGFDLSHSSLSPYTNGESSYGDALNASNIVNAIHNAGGLAILAHPARYRLPYLELLNEAIKIGFDGAEAWYDYEHKKIWKPTRLICSTIDKLLKDHGLLSTCGTDTHGYDLTTR